MNAHGPELEDLDQLVVEAVALLAEEDRPWAIEFDGQCHQEHDRRHRNQDQRSHQFVKQPLENEIPIGDRLVEDRNEGQVADVRVRSRPETQPVGVSR